MKYVVTIFVFLSLLALSSAQLDIITYPAIGTFTAYSSQGDFSMCQCSGLVDSVTIENTGAYTSRYTLTSNLPNLVTVPSNSVELSPGRSTSIPISISAPCDSEDSFDLVYEVSDVFGNVAQIEKSLLVGRCQNLLASLFEENVSSIKPCQSLDYTIQVTNTGSFTEEYDIVFGGPEFEEYFTSPYRTVSLEPAQIVELKDALTLDCSMYGDFTIPFGVQAVNNELVTEFASFVSVEQDYPFSVSFAPDSVCLHDSSLIPITISSPVFDTNFSLSLHAPAWASLANGTSVSVLAGEEVTVFVEVNPTALGEFPINLSVTSSLSGMSSSISDVLVVENCFDLDALVVGDSNIVDCVGLHSYPVIINNTGTVEVPVRLDVLGHESFSLSEKNFDLAPGVSHEVALLVNATNSFSAKAQLIAGIVDKGSFADDSISVRMLSEYECFEVELVDDLESALYSDSIAYFQTEHVGLVKDSYKVSVQSDPFLASGLAPGAINMSPGFVLNIPFAMHADASPALSAYGGFIVVSRTAWNGSVMNYDLPFTLKLHQKNIFVRAYDYFSVHFCYFVSLIVLVLLLISVFILIARKKSERKFRTWLFFILLVVWLLIAVVGLSMYGVPDMYDSLPEPEDSYDFVIAEDTFLTLDANEYFTDPDNNSLTYEVSEMDNISVVVDTSFITFTPDANFAGERRFRITAFDGLDDTRSDRLTLIVVDRPEYSVWDLYTKYCFLVNLVLLALLFILAFFVFKKGPRKRKTVLSARSSSVAPSPAKEVKKTSVKKTSVKKKSATKKKPAKKAVKKKVVKKSVAKKVAKKKPAKNAK